MVYPKSLRELKTTVSAAKHRFTVSEAEALSNLLLVLRLSERAYPPAPLSTTADGDIVITCELCADTQWWRDNYGSLWEWAQWWYCGPFGLDCNPSPA